MWWSDALISKKCGGKTSSGVQERYIQKTNFGLSILKMEDWSEDTNSMNNECRHIANNVELCRRQQCLTSSNGGGGGQKDAKLAVDYQVYGT